MAGQASGRSNREHDHVARQQASNHRTIRPSVKHLARSPGKPSTASCLATCHKQSAVCGLCFVTIEQALGILHSVTLPYTLLHSVTLPYILLHSLNTVRHPPSKVCNPRRFQRVIIRKYTTIVNITASWGRISNGNLISTAVVYIRSIARAPQRADNRTEA